MKKKFIVSLIILLIILILVFFVIKAKKRLAKAPIYKHKTISVTTIRAKKQNICLSNHYVANLVSDNTSILQPKITAEIIEVFKDEGDFVKKGELLAKLYDKDILSEIGEISNSIEATKAKIKATESQLLGAKSEYEFLSKEYDRIKELYLGKALSKSDFDEITARRDIAKQTVSSLKETISSLKSTLKSQYSKLEGLKIRLSYTKIIAPIDGVVEARYQDVGDLANPSKPLFKISSLHKLKLIFSVVQEDLAFLQIGQKIKINWPKISKGSNLPTYAQITKIYPSLINGKSTYVEAFLGKINEILPIGEYVPIDVVFTCKEGITVPSSAIVSNNKTTGVYVVKQNKLQFKPIDIIMKTPEYTVIKGNIGENEDVVVGDYLNWIKLAPEMKVEASL